MQQQPEAARVARHMEMDFQAARRRAGNHGRLDPRARDRLNEPQHPIEPPATERAAPLFKRCGDRAHKAADTLVKTGEAQPLHLSFTHLHPQPPLRVDALKVDHIDRHVAARISGVERARQALEAVGVGRLAQERAGGGLQLRRDRGTGDSQPGERRHGWNRHGRDWHGRTGGDGGGTARAGAGKAGAATDPSKAPIHSQFRLWQFGLWQSGRGQFTRD